MSQNPTLSLYITIKGNFMDHIMIDSDLTSANIHKPIREFIKRGHHNHIKTQKLLDWFKSIKNKKIYKFLSFDIVSFYPSITQELLEEALVWAMQYTSITEQQKKIVLLASKSFLYCKDEPWVKKGDSNFDVGMGAYHGAQACELVGLYLLSKLVKLPNFEPIVYYACCLIIWAMTQLMYI